MANGTCTFYHRSGKLSFQGYLKNGYRYRIGVEYTEEGEVIYKGVFKDGHRYPYISKRADDSDLWYERDQYGNLKATDHKVENGLNHGNYFFYEWGKLSILVDGSTIKRLRHYTGLVEIK